MRETHEANADTHQQTLLPVTGGSWHNFFFFFFFFFGATKVCLPRQIRFCRDNFFFFFFLSLPKMILVAALSLVGAATSIESFVAASILLSRQNTSFVGTKRILVAAPASDSYIPPTKTWQHFTTSSHLALQDAVTLGCVQTPVTLGCAAHVQKVHNSYLHG